MLFTNLVQTNLRTKFLGQQIEYYTRLKSTNEEAWELFNDDAQPGTVVITDNQFGGKGRNSRSWFTIANKSLSFSILIKKEIPIKLCGWIPIITALSIERGLQNFQIQTSFKWPNDILLDRKKMGGVLIESKVKGTLVNKLIIGIGLNINESKDELDSSISEVATSLHIHSGKIFQRERILAAVLNEMEQIIEEFPKNIDKICENWITNCDHLDKKIQFHSGSDVISGVFKGLGENGSAIIKTNQSEQEFHSGEIY